MCKYCENIKRNHCSGCEVIANSPSFDKDVVEQESFALDYCEVSCRFRELKDEGTTICIDDEYGATIDIYVKYCPFCGRPLL